MRVDLIASLPHYLDHAEPIWRCLPADMQGDVHPLRHPVRPPLRNRIALVAGWQDVQTLRPHHRMIYVEHGAGQGYAGDPKSAQQPGYSTSRGHRHGGVEMFICPSETVAARWVTAPAVAVGCPKLDQYLTLPPPPTDRPAVCMAWHWESLIAPEARSAFGHYEPMLPEVIAHYRQQGFDVYGHAHPRWEGALDDRLRAAGFDVLATDAEVFARAHILMVDNSSLGMEFMALGRPTVWLNAPWYRRSVHHGGRFWDWTDGIPTFDDPDDLLRLNLWDYVHDDGIISASARQRVVDSVYAYTDGCSAQRAADAIARMFREQ